MNGNGYREENSCCYFHPKQVLVGVCSLCLNERLLILAAKQGHSSASRATHRPQTANHRRPHASIHKIFAFGSLFTRPESKQWKSENYDPDDASSSQEDSFISIKFEENGVASWEKNSTVSKVSLENCSSMSWNHQSKETKSVIEHGKSRDTFRWRKRVGHMFQLIRWKRSTKASVCHVGTKVEGVKVRKGWMRTLTKRKNTEKS
ncbi:hypothetical protein L6164_016187 [Bauhinia variegata]|uniref:Uncharacterized protein n=1 Tax=Bauhinia variegata TaxID=167791 RepID=A0ACB9NS01_BAUVA|nr:hypothetical protein L6164_016187 [Bauhinia variegata]